LHFIPASQRQVAGYRIGEGALLRGTVKRNHSTFIFAAFLARLRPTSRRQSSRRALRAAKQVLEFRSASSRDSHQHVRGHLKPPRSRSRPGQGRSGGH
jgi:hypothetical protein